MSTQAPFRPRRIYLASSWRNIIQPGIVVALRRAGHDVYDFKNPRPGDNGFHWSEVDGGWKTWDVARYRDALNHPIAEAGYKSDRDAMEWADTCVLLLPCGRSAHIEAGYFHGAKKDLFILIFEHQEPELMYKMATGVLTSMNELFDAVGCREDSE